MGFSCLVPLAWIITDYSTIKYKHTTKMEENHYWIVDGLSLFTFDPLYNKTQPIIQVSAIH